MNSSVRRISDALLIPAMYHRFGEFERPEYSPPRLKLRRQCVAVAMLSVTRCTVALCC